MEPKIFKIEHNVYRDTFSKATHAERGLSPQRGKRTDEASPTKRKYQQMQTSLGCKSIPGESLFSHELGQVVENSCQLLGRLGGLFNNSELSDVRLVVLSGSGERKEYPAHKLILCSASEVFKVMLTGKSWNECNTFEVCLNEDPNLSPVFELFLEYLYSGRIALQHSMVLNVLMLADKYDVKDLQEVCINYMCCHLVSTMEQNRAISWLQYGQYAGHKHLATECQQFICLNFYKVLSCPDFMSLEFELLLFFLKQSDLVIPDEFILYQGVVHWWLSNLCHRPIDLVAGGDESGSGSPPSSKCFPEIPISLEVDFSALDFIQAHELFSSIRFPLMTHTQLNAINSDVDRFRHSESGHFHTHGVMSPSSLSSSSSSSSSQYLYDRKLRVLLAVVEEYAKKALMLQDVAKSAIHLRDLCNYLKNKFDESQVTPRNYTNEIWSTTLCIDKFASLPQHEVRSVVFSSPSSSILPDETNSAWDWTVELFPKGVVFQRCIMIGLWRNVEVHGDTYSTVRLTLHCNQSKECTAMEKGQDVQRGQRNVTVCVLVTGVQDNVEHICRMVKRSLSFDSSDRTRHINDLVPYHLLNQSASFCRSQTQTGRPIDAPPPSCTLLSGAEGDSLKVTIVIKPSPAFYFKQMLP